MTAFPRRCADPRCRSGVADADAAIVRVAMEWRKGREPLSPDGVALVAAIDARLALDAPPDPVGEAAVSLRRFLTYGPVLRAEEREQLSKVLAAIEPAAVGGKRSREGKE